MAAFTELLEELGAQHRRLVEQLSDPEDELSLLEAHRWILSILEVAADVQVWADPARPRFVDIVGPYKKWGGDNADAFYCFAPVDPDRTYDVEVQIGDAVYLSLTVYGGPNDGRCSERIVGSLNSRQAPPGADGVIEMVLGQGRPGRWTTLDPVGPGRGVRYHTRLTGGPGDRPQGAMADRGAGPAGDTAGYRCGGGPPFPGRSHLGAEQAQMVPLPLGQPNTIDPPYPVPTTTFGWAAGDAAYAMGSFDLGEGQRLVIRGRPPECAFWNMCLWNPFLHTYDYDYERVTINGAQVSYEPDGSWTIVVAPNDPGAGYPNWVSTAGHRRGRIWFRWFLPETTPDQPTVEVIG